MMGAQLMRYAQRTGTEKLVAIGTLVLAWPDQGGREGIRQSSESGCWNIQRPCPLPDKTPPGLCRQPIVCRLVRGLVVRGQ